MAIKLRTEDQEFRNPLLFIIEAKGIDLNRLLLNLFMLIKYNGAMPRPRIGTRTFTPEFITDRFIKMEEQGMVEGFKTYKDQVHWWVMTNLLDLVNRGKPGDEAVASLKAVHLNSYKFRNARQVRDYNSSQQVFAMMRESPLDLVKLLKDFLEEGWDTMTKSPGKSRLLDLDILGILRIVEGVKDEPTSDNFKPPRCLCQGQARMFCDDVRRILVYKSAVPRHVILEYLKTIIGLNIGLYLFKLFKMLPDYVNRGERHPDCVNCPVSPKSDNPYAKCPYHSEFVVDCGDNPNTRISDLAKHDAAWLYGRMHDYIRATFSINMALQYLGLTRRKDSEDIDKALNTIKERSDRFELRFQMRIEDICNSLNAEQQSQIEPILKLRLSKFDTFIELISHIRSSFHNEYHRKLLDSMLQRNRESGLLWSGKGRTYGRRFRMSSRLLETMVQLAVLQVDPQIPINPFYSEPIIIEDFLAWLKNRYGMIINGINHPRFETGDLNLHQAFRENAVNIKNKLREIGFFNVLSDAYIMQRIRPRYPIEKGEPK